MTRSELEKAVQQTLGDSWTYEPERLPYVKNYIPDFGHKDILLEIKGVLTFEDQTKLLRVANLLSGQEAVLLVPEVISEKSEELLKELQMSLRADGILHDTRRIPKRRLVVVPQLRETEIRRFKALRKKWFGASKSRNKTGINIVYWCDSVGIDCVPVSFKDMSHLKKLIDKSQ